MNVADRSGPVNWPEPMVHYDPVPPLKSPFALCPNNGYFAHSSFTVGSAIEWEVSGLAFNNAGYDAGGGWVSPRDYTAWIWTNGGEIRTGSGEITRYEPNTDTILDGSGTTNNIIQPDTRFIARLSAPDVNTVNWLLVPKHVPQSQWGSYTSGMTKTDLWVSSFSIAWGWPPSTICTKPMWSFPHGVVIHSFSFSLGT